MFKHQQTLSCRQVASQKGQQVDEKAKDILVVVVKNYQGPRLDPQTEIPRSPVAPTFKAEERKEPEEHEEPEEEVEVEMDEKTREVDEALRALVEEWNREGNDLNCNLMKERKTDSNMAEGEKTDSNLGEGKKKDSNSLPPLKYSLLDDMKLQITR